MHAYRMEHTNSPHQAFQASLPPGTAPAHAHVNELTGLRGLAALCVLINHLFVLFPPLKSTTLAPFLKQSGILGMSLFFSLSGFVIMYNYGQRIRRAPAEGIKTFCVGRFARLFPLYIVFLMGFFVFNTFFAGKDLNEIFACVITLPLWALGMQSWVYGFVNDIPVVFLQGRASLLWSVSTELALYGAFIPLCFVLARLNRPWHVWLALLLVGALHGVFVYVARADGALSVYMNGEFSVYKNFDAWKWLLYYSPPGRLFEFLTGCLAAVLYAHGHKSEQVTCVFRWLSGLMLVGVLGLWAFPLQGDLAFIVQPLFIAGFVFCLAQGGSVILRSPILLYMGEISYSTYLLHAIWLQLLAYSGDNLWVRCGILVVYGVGTYTLAHVVYTKLEVPARRLLRGRFALSR